MCVCWFVGLLVCFLSATRHLSTLRRCLRVAERAGSAVVGSGPARAGKCMHVHSENTRAHAVQLLNEKIAALMPFKNHYPYACAHAVVYVTAEIFKKREKENQHATSQVQFTVCLLLEFTFRIVQNRFLHKSSLLAPMESRRTRRPTFTAEERLERRKEQDRRRHAERRARQRRDQTQARRDAERLRCSQARA